tara:strand:+ start:2885 stop:3490 length:606 start_codon:yes stop_codon:yes gene_type:complete
MLGNMEVTFIYIILSIVLLWFVIGAKGKWTIKMIAIFATLMFSLNIERSLENLYGWPSGQDLPDRFLVHWILVKEPNDSLNDDGGVYLWVNDISETETEEESTWEFFKDNDDSKPRVYHLPYSIERHEMGIKMKERLLAGFPIIGMSEDEYDKENSPNKLLDSLLDKEKRKNIGSIEDYDSDEDLFFYELPASGLVSKSVE